MAIKMKLDRIGKENPKDDNTRYVAYIKIYDSNDNKIGEFSTAYDENNLAEFEEACLRQINKHNQSHAKEMDIKASIESKLDSINKEVTK